jgi:hypothetical protein
MYIAGLKGKLVIKRLDNTWSIYKYNFDLKEEKRIGTYLENRYLGMLIFDVIGVHQIECNNQGTKERGYLKLTNVSTQYKKDNIFYVAKHRNISQCSVLL